MDAARHPKRRSGRAVGSSRNRCGAGPLLEGRAHANGALTGRFVILSARLCENSDSNAIPEKPSLIHRAGATISIGGMILVSPFSASVRVFTQSRAAKDLRRPGTGRPVGTMKILRLTAQDDTTIAAPVPRR